MREIHTFKRYFQNFYDSLLDAAKEKVDYALMLLKTQSWISARFVKHVRSRRKHRKRREMRLNWQNE